VTVMTRRNLLGGAAGLAATAALNGADARMPLRANVILPGVTAIYTIAGQAGYRESDDAAVLAQEHKRFGYTAAFCPDANPGDAARVNAIRQAFAEAGVLIAEVGAWRNMMTPDPEARKANIEYVTRQLALADNSPIRFYNNSELIRETFQKLGKWVLSCHAKDLKWVPQVNLNFQEVPAGQGGIPGQGGGVNYHAHIAEVNKAGVPLMQEHWNTNDELQLGDRYNRRVAAELGVLV
jgi:sugar phosphate isomerase/epimerase